MVQADYLFLMTDVDCLYNKNPRTHADAEAIEVVQDVSSVIADVSTAGSRLGTGGMSTKIVAARLATSAGVTTIITRSSNPGNIYSIVKYVQALKQSSTDPPSGTLTPSTDDTLIHSTSSLQLEALLKPPLHTRFLPDPHPVRDRSFWLLHGLAPHGTIYIDRGAHRALTRKAGLLPRGIVDVEGRFAQQEAVRIVVVQRPGRHQKSTSTLEEHEQFPSSHVPANTSSNDNKDDDSNASEQLSEISEFAPFEVGRALVNYSDSEIGRIKGLNSSEIEGVLGYADSEYVALRQNISLIRTGKEKERRGVKPPSVLNLGIQIA